MHDKIAVTVNLLDKAKEILKIDPGDAQREWKSVTQLVAEAPEQSRVILEWLFECYIGYIDTRVKAGREVLAVDPTRGWVILEKLIHSSDPDDRDTALTLLIESNDPRSAIWARELLSDKYPYLRLEAAEFLLFVYPKDVLNSLQELLLNEAVWVRKQAAELISSLEYRSDNF